MSALPALLGQRLRRDAVQLTLWIVGTGALAGATFAGVAGSYGTDDERAALLATAVANPVVLLFRGLPSGADEGAFLGFLILPFLVMLAAFMGSFLAVRHTRAEEEAGRAELIGATPAGRLAPPAATLVHGVAAIAALGVLCALVLAATGLGVRGALTMGLTTAAGGVTFLALTLLGAQLVRTSHAANALGVWTILIAFLLSGLGNAAGTPGPDAQRIDSGWLAWLSPFGWAENTRPYDADDLRPLLLCLALAALAAGAALALQSRRDIGEGLLPDRHGPRTASPALAGPGGLLWRLSRGAVLGWAIGGLLTGVLATRLAAVLQDVGAQVPSVGELSDALADGGSPSQAAVAIFFTMLGVLTACCAVQIVARARQDAVHGTAEPVLAGAVSRMRWLAAHLVVAAVAMALTVAAAIGGAAIGLATLPAPDWSLMADVAVTGVGQLIAAAVFPVLTALVFVAVPRATIPLGWTLVLVGTVVGLFGPLFGFPQGLVDASPIAVAPTVTGDGVDLRGLGWLLLAIAAGTAASLALAHRREPYLGG